MTIEARAKYSQSQHKDESKRNFNTERKLNFSDWEYGYCQGATEQKAVDIEKACGWIRGLYPPIDGRDNTTIAEKMVEKFCKAMEE